MTHDQTQDASSKPASPSGASERIPSLDTLQPHDHLCLIYESQEEWRAAIVPFFSQGLQRGEACIYLAAEARQTEEARRCLAEAGVDVVAMEHSGQLAILNGAESDMRDSVFDPDGMRALLVEKTRAARAGGAPALRVFIEMSWGLRSRPDPHQLRKYEAALCQEFLLRHPCLAVCAYDRKRFAPALLKQVLQSQPFLIRRQQVYRNPYFLPLEDTLDPEKDEKEVQRWLDNIEREPSLPLALRERESLFMAALDHLSIGVAFCSMVPAVTFEYMNNNLTRLFRTTRDELAEPDAFWGVVFKDPASRESIRRHMLEGCASGNPAQLHWPNLPLERPGEDTTYVTITLFPISGQALCLLIVCDETESTRIETEWRSSEHRFRELFENMSSGVAVYEAVDEAQDFVFLAFNAAGERIEQISREQVLGRRMKEIFPQAEAIGLLDVFRRVWRTGQPEDHPAVEYRDGRLTGWRENRVYKLSSGEIVAVYNDITGRKGREQRILHLNRLLYTLLRVNEAIVQTEECASLLNHLCRILVEVGEFQTAWMGFTNPSDDTVHVVAVSGVGEEALRAYFPISLHSPQASGPIGSAIQSGEAVVVVDIQHDPRVEIWREDLIQSKVNTVGAFPIRQQGAVIGALSISSTRTNAIEDEEITLLNELALNIGHALDAIDAREFRRKAELVLRESERQLSRGQAIAHTGSWVWTFANESLIWSEEMYQIWGLEKDSSLTFDKIADRLYVDDPSTKMARVRELFAPTANVVEDEFCLMHPDGTVRHIRYQVEVDHDESGKPERASGVLQDITKQKETDRKMAAQLDELRRWYRVTQGREERVLELKREVNLLLRRLGESPKYETTE